MNLTSAMVAEKEELKGTSERLKGYEKDVTYVANEAIFFASSKDYANKVAKGYGATVASYGDGIAVMTFDDEVTEIIAMAEDSDVKLPAVYPNYIYTIYDDIEVITAQDIEVKATGESDPILGEQSYHADINSEGAWEYNPTAGKGIKVAVIDSGIQKNHEDLKNRVASATATYSTPYNKAEDNHGHGTHVSGIIAANRNNMFGGAGIAYQSTVVSIKALENNPITHGASGSTADIIKAVNAAVKSGARVINMSLGGYHYDALYEAVIDNAVNKGVVVVAAAGNESTKLSKDILSDEYVSPACFDNVITVSAKETGAASLAGFSNYGEGIVDITAPGTYIASTMPENRYAYMSGTSQATPMVAATAAYILSVNSDLKNNKTKATVDTVKKILQDSATKTGYTDSAKFGAGLLNVEAAVKMAAPSKANNTELQAPVVTIDNKTVQNNQKIQDTDLITLSAKLGNSTDENVKIYYTLDGKNPTEKSNLYEEPFKLEMSGNKTIKAMAVYYGKKSKVTTIKVKVNAYAQSFAITSKSKYDYVSSGKSLTLVAGSFEPSYTTNKKVQWSIVSGGNYATIDKNKGVLKAKKVTEEKTVRVQAVALDRKSGAASATIDITIMPTVSKLSLKNEKDKEVTLKYPETKKMEVVVAPEGISAAVTYTSSNEKVATVDPYTGLVTSVGAGKATITAKTVDGSNKKATMKVTVTKDVESVKLTSKTGEYQFSAGNKLQLVATVTSDASNKAVKWTIDGEVPAGVAIKNGTLTANKKKVTKITKVTVRAAAQADLSIYDTVTVTIYPSAATKIALEGVEKTNTYTLGIVAKGDLKTTVQLYPYTDNYSANSYGRKKGSKANDLDKFTYTSNNTNVATVSETGFVTAKSVGTAKIKIAAKDGSGKSVTCTIKVVKPVVQMYVYSKTGVSFVAKGKTLSLGALTNTDATNKKVKWTSENTKIATVNASNGKVTGKGYGSTTITATALDGSGVSAKYTVTVRPKITKFGYYSENSKSATDLYATVKTTFKLEDYKEAYSAGDMDDYNFSNYLPYYVDESSSTTVNGDISEILSITSYSVTNSNVIQVVYNNQDGYMYVVPVNKGTADLVFKALDGSGKTCKLKITVK